MKEQQWLAVYVPDKLQHPVGNVLDIDYKEAAKTKQKKKKTCLLTFPVFKVSVEKTVEIYPNSFCAHDNHQKCSFIHCSKVIVFFFIQEVLTCIT